MADKIPSHLRQSPSYSVRPRSNKECVRHSAKTVSDTMADGTQVNVRTTIEIIVYVRPMDKDTRKEWKRDCKIQALAERIEPIQSTANYANGNVPIAYSMEIPSENVHIIQRLNNVQSLECRTTARMLGCQGSGEDKPRFHRSARSQRILDKQADMRSKKGLTLWADSGDTDAISELNKRNRAIEDKNRLAVLNLVRFLQSKIDYAEFSKVTTLTVEQILEFIALDDRLAWILQDIQSVDCEVESILTNPTIWNNRNSDSIAGRKAMEEFDIVASEYAKISDVAVESAGLHGICR